MILHRFQCRGTDLLVLYNKYDGQRDFFQLADYYVAAATVVVVAVFKLGSL